MKILMWNRNSHLSMSSFSVREREREWNFLWRDFQSVTHARKWKRKAEGNVKFVCMRALATKKVSFIDGRISSHLTEKCGDMRKSSNLIKKINAVKYLRNFSMPCHEGSLQHLCSAFIRSRSSTSRILNEIMQGVTCRLISQKCQLL